MTIATTTHLNLPGTARPALELYRSVFGGDLTTVTYGDAGMPADAPGADRIVFGHLESSEGFRVMAYDVPGQDGGDLTAGSTRRENGLTITDRPFFLSIRAESLDEATRYWDGLADGATVIEPLAASPWSPGFGMLTDRFGVTWVVDVAAPRA
ncbi:VOC family protein [Nocardioides sp. TF02-7]|uniref:VOC family protein n=1 Tax=Nocardioides sp. TF02-7 TaxID=2917724 RepID=UPI001F050922|nr:VOC family protein [Nocardioides sp. TF02-7]UMG94413.1 VOC family protein [Nocardioides sp. TF02-7]